MEESCKNCYFFRADPSKIALREGSCRYESIRLVSFPTQRGPAHMGQFPPTHEDFWCGQWRTKETVQ